MSQNLTKTTDNNYKLKKIAEFVHINCTELLNCVLF